MNHFDCIIIGGGPAGLTAGLYLARGKQNTLLFEKYVLGGQIALTHLVENYPGFPEGISGLDLTERFRLQAERFGLKIKQEEVLSLEKEGDSFLIKTRESKYFAKSIVLAVGSNPRKLGVPGEEEFLNRGVSYCATCDGALFDGLDIAVVGGGDSAAQESLFLTKFARKLYLIHRREQMRAQPALRERVFANKKIEFLPNKVVRQILGSTTMTGLLLEDTKTGEQSHLSVEGLFVFIGLEPNTGFLKGFIELDERGYIITDERLQTSAKGVFAAGDCRKGASGQVAIAVGEGCKAALEVEHYLQSLVQCGKN
ncbi:MAG: thioredoxin-disulfide reductase [Aquificaceae bacterium]